MKKIYNYFDFWLFTVLLVLSSIRAAYLDGLATGAMLFVAVGGTAWFIWSFATKYYMDNYMSKLSEIVLEMEKQEEEKDGENISKHSEDN